MLNEIEIYFRDLSTDAQHAVLDAVNKGGSVDIMLDDLEDDKQAELLDSAGVTDPEMMNWDTMPVTVVEFDPPKPGDPPVRRAEDMNWDTIPLTTWEYEDELEEDVFDAEENPRRGKMISRRTRGIYGNPRSRHGAVPAEVFVESDVHGLETFMATRDFNKDRDEMIEQIASLVDNAVEYFPRDGVERVIGIRVGGTS